MKLSSYPHLVKEWHPTKNGDLKPSEVTKGSDKKVWWLCPNGHPYEAVIEMRTRKDYPMRCQYCTGRKTLNHELFV